MPDNIPLQRKDCEILDCLLRTKHLFFMLSAYKPIQRSIIKTHVIVTQKNIIIMCMLNFLYLYKMKV